MISLRQSLNAMGIDGLECEQLIAEYHSLCRIYPSITMNLFLRQVKDSRR